MATVIKASEWFDSAWDDGNTGTTSIQVGDTFTVSTIDTANRALRLAVLSSNYAGGQLLCTMWDDASFWSGQPGANPFSVNQVFTVQSIDLSNRIVYLSG